MALFLYPSNEISFDLTLNFPFTIFIRHFDFCLFFGQGILCIIRPSVYVRCNKFNLQFLASEVFETFTFARFLLSKKFLRPITNWANAFFSTSKSVLKDSTMKMTIYLYAYKFCVHFFNMSFFSLKGAWKSRIDKVDNWRKSICSKMFWRFTLPSKIDSILEKQVRFNCVFHTFRFLRFDHKLIVYYW